MRVCPRRHYHTSVLVFQNEPTTEVFHFWCHDCGATRRYFSYKKDEMITNDTGWVYPAITGILRGRSSATIPVSDGVYDGLSVLKGGDPNGRGNRTSGIDSVSSSMAPQGSQPEPV